MRRAIPAAFIIAVIGAATVPAGAQAANQTVVLHATDYIFSPERVAIRPGETVTWNNPGSSDPHNVRFEDGQFTQPATPATTFPPKTRTFTTTGTYAYYCEVHGSPGGVGMVGVVYVNATGELPPLAKFSVAPNPGVAGQAITFDARSSSVITGRTIIKYEWDLDGDGMFELSDTTPTTSRVYLAAQDLSVKLRVTDSQMAVSDVRAQDVRIEPAPQPPPPPSPAPAPAPAPAPVSPTPAAPVSRDSLPPAISGFRATNTRFRLGTGRTRASGTAAAARTRLGTTFQYRLSEAGDAKLVIAVRSSGRVIRTLRRRSRQGLNKVAFSGRIGTQALKPGAYRATLTATDRVGNTSKAKTTFFRVVKR